MKCWHFACSLLPTFGMNDNDKSHFRRKETTNSWKMIFWFNFSRTPKVLTSNINNVRRLPCREKIFENRKSYWLKIWILQIIFMSSRLEILQWISSEIWIFHIVFSSNSKFQNSCSIRWLQTRRHFYSFYYRLQTRFIFIFNLYTFYLHAKNTFHGFSQQRRTTTMGECLNCVKKKEVKLRIDLTSIK